MDILESFYEQEYLKLNIYERKRKIEHKKTVIYGAPRCGKSFLLYDAIREQKKGRALYIDCTDPRVNIKELQNSLQNFIKLKKIELLALDNFKFEFEPPECDGVLIATNTHKSMDGFETIMLSPLDFEEYIEFEKKFTNITNSFSLYLKDGSLPEIPFLHDTLKIKRLQELAILCTKSQSEYEIFKLLASSTSRKVTVFQLFNELKQKIKISKDTFYLQFSQFLDRKIIFLVEKFREPNAPKKLYFYDFAFKGALSLEKDFAALFENMIFMELQGRASHVYYDDFVEFLMPNCAVFKLPFGQKEHIIGKIERSIEALKRCDTKEAIFVTLGFTECGEFGGVRYEAIPFWEWAVMA